ncbi:MAG: type III-A CRISPR-associated RAMP protein Csm3 [Bryobacterales bacterium]|nr:type III-A CRISPR-associated RAMP protein Csm3 [Bryobacterales bacterium]MBV9399379.1 type III-A CRISPR-associated RAMP protein Csm3 [Bryobacterales bacterium]
MPKWTSVVEIKFEIELLDGMRIGGASGGLEIGGVDPNLMSLKDPVSGEPYIPGSSLKGKLRSTLEKEHGLCNHGKPCGCGKRNCQVCPVFGAHMNTRADCGTARLTVRDAHFTEEYRKLCKDNPVFEVKTENIIDRNRGLAEHPRTQERVAAGAKFAVELVLKVYEGDDETVMVENLKHALAVLQRYDSLGAGGSRGSGRIGIRNFSEPKKVKLADVTL